MTRPGDARGAPEGPVLAFRAPLPNNRANSRGNWRVSHFGKRAYWKALDELALVKLIPGRPAEPLARAAVAIELTLHNPMDPDNLTARVKDLLDWLVVRGYLAGDTARHIQLKVTQRVSRKKLDQGARVEIAPWDSPADQRPAGAA